METTIIKVAGMSCGGCVSSVTKVLQGLPGVASATVSLERGEATVEFESASVTREALAQAVEDAGFEAS
jgi:copper chaperone